MAEGELPVFLAHHPSAVRFDAFIARQNRIFKNHPEYTPREVVPSPYSERRKNTQYVPDHKLVNIPRMALTAEDELEKNGWGRRFEANFKRTRWWPRKKFEDVIQSLHNTVSQFECTPRKRQRCAHVIRGRLVSCSTFLLTYAMLDIGATMQGMTKYDTELFNYNFNNWIKQIADGSIAETWKRLYGDQPFGTPRLLHSRG